MATSLAERIRRHEAENAWQHEWCVAEEDMPKLAVWGWRPGTRSRVFRSRNVIPIELARRLRDQMRAHEGKAAGSP
jgi:hypothetical protein